MKNWWKKKFDSFWKKNFTISWQKWTTMAISVAKNDQKLAKSWKKLAKTDFEFGAFPHAKPPKTGFVDPEKNQKIVKKNFGSKKKNSENCTFCKIGFGQFVQLLASFWPFFSAFVIKRRIEFRGFQK